MGYKLLGFVVWRAGRRYLRHRYGGWLTRRRLVLAGGVLAVGAAVAVAASRSSQE